MDARRHPRRHVEPDDLREGARRGQRLRRAARASSRRPGADTKDAYWDLVTTDIANAADLLRPVYDALDGADGFVSVEVDPDLAHDTADTVKQAAELFERLGKPNVMIKIPAHRPNASPRSARRSRAGINVNVTLIFALEPARAR